MSRARRSFSSTTTKTLCGSRFIADVRRKASQSRDFSKEDRDQRRWMVTYCMKYLWTADKKRRAWITTLSDFVIDKKKIGNRLWIFAREYGKILRFLWWCDEWEIEFRREPKAYRNILWTYYKTERAFHFDQVFEMQWMFYQRLHKCILNSISIVTFIKNSFSIQFL